MLMPLLTLIAATLVVTGQAPGTMEESVIAAERQWAAAMVARDLPALRDIFADDLVYVHGSGAVETKAEFLEKLATGARAYTHITPLEPRARVYGDTAVVADLLDVGVVSGEQRLTVRVRTINVFLRRGGRWQIVAHQATRLSQAP